MYHVYSEMIAQYFKQMILKEITEYKLNIDKNI